MKLPNGERAEIADKLEAYVLNPLHPLGKYKARVFQSRLGITIANVEVLRRALLEAAAVSDSAETRGDSGFGEVFVLPVPIATATGNATVLSAWIVRRSEDFPRLITCYIV